MIEELLASRVKIKILRFFFEYPLIKRNVREIAKECKIGFGVSANSLRELNIIGMTRMEKVGKEMVYSLDQNSKFFEPLKKIFEIEKDNTANLPYLYRNLISDLTASTKRLADACLLFGSLVTGNFTSRSDVDLFFISNKQDEIRKKCLEIEDRYGIKLQVIIIKKDDLKEFRKSSLYNTIRKESLFLFGGKELI